MVRLVKGATRTARSSAPRWAGRPDYPVYTTKAATDLSYLGLRPRPDRRPLRIYAQFATHNAQHPGGRAAHGPRGRA